MKTTPILLTLCLALNTAVASPPPSPPTDDLDAYIRQHTLVNQIQHVGRNVRESASELVLTAMGFVGVPYRYGGTSAETGVDCSGFVRVTFEKTLGKILPRRAAEQAAVTTKIDKADLKPGDLVFFNTMRRAFSHVGIYVGDGKFIHAPRSGANVRLESMDIDYWTSRFDGARRVLTDDAAPLQIDAKAFPVSPGASEH